MRHACLVVAAVLACACTRVDGGGGTTGGCIESTTWQSASRTLDLGINDTAIDNGAGGFKVAQSFLVTGDTGSTRSIGSVALPLYASATFGGAGTTTLTLRQDSSGVPGGILTSTSVSVTTATAITSATPTLVTFTFSSAPNLSVGSTYWIVLDTSYGQQTTPVVKWAADDGNSNASAYANGQAKYEMDGTAGTANTFGTGTTLGGLRQLGFQINCN